jgi:hypothetical protein
MGRAKGRTIMTRTTIGRFADHQQTTRIPSRLEPRIATREAGRDDAQVAAPAASRERDARSTATATPRTDRSRRLRPRHLWLLPGLGLALFANTQASQLAVGLVPLLVFGIVPDLPRFVGIRRPTVLELHNAMHQPAFAVAVLFGAAVTGMSPFVYVGALAWLGHIVVGWGIGDRIKSEVEPGREVHPSLV